MSELCQSSQRWASAVMPGIQSDLFSLISGRCILPESERFVIRWNTGSLRREHRLEESKPVGDRG